MISGAREKVGLKSVRISLIVFILLASIAVSPVSAEEIADLEAIEEKPYVFIETKPFLFLTGGYRFINASGDINIAEYEYLNDSIVLGGELRKFKYPHRLFIEFDFKNKKDYFAEFRYSYKDIVYLRAINRMLFHNLQNITLASRTQTTPPPPFAPAFDQRDLNEKYGIKTGINAIFIRFKTPDFPAHLYINADQVDKDGSQQQRTLLGSGWFNSPVRTSQKRDIDLKTSEITVGANSHLGPIEIDYSHSQKRLDVGGDSVLYHNYTDAGFLHPSFNNIRLAGTFPHNLIPELKGTTNTIKIHTSYTGSLVASATFTKIDRENTISRAKADYFIGSGEVQWMPMHKLAFFLRYKHKDTDIDNPSQIPVNYLGYTSYTSAISVKPSISSITDTISGVVRYRPIKGLTLKADYTYENIKRHFNEKWHLPDSTLKHIFSLSADTQILKNLNLKARYIYKEIDDPAYNTEPNTYNEGRLSVSWSPAAEVTTLLSSSISKGKRDDLFFKESKDAQNREATRNSLIGSITFSIKDNLSVTTSYSYMNNKIKQDIVYQINPDSYQIDRAVPYKDNTNNYAIDLNYTPKKYINLNAGVSHTISKARFTPHSDDLLSPVSIASFSALKTRETVYSASGEYKLKNDFSLALTYKLIDFNDVLDSQYDELKDGTAHITMLTISKRW